MRRLEALPYFACISLGLMLGVHASAQPCLTGYSLTASTPPSNGTYACGETVTFCLTVSGWNTTNANWFHGVSASFGPGWDLSTLVPSAPPPTAGTSGGTWGWYNSVQGTAGTNIGPQGPGFFFDLNNDGNPGNNFGDYATGSWTFCWTISVLSGPACINGLGLGVTVNTFGDSETGSWGSSGCGGDVLVPSQPAVIQACSANAGAGGALALCSTSAVADLQDALIGSPDPGGIWTDPTGQPHSGMLDPATDPSGDYTYTVGSVNPPCSASATIMVSIAQQPDAGTDAALTLCASDGTEALFSALGGNPDPAGSWSGPNGPSNGTFDPATSVPGAYTYQVSGTAPCVSVTSTVIVNVNPSLSAGMDASLVICSDASPVNMIAQLGGTPDPIGTWTGPDGTAVTGIFTPGVSPPGPYIYAVPGQAPCPGSQAILTITENSQPDAGLDAEVSVCESDSPVPLLGLLGGTPDAGGIWLNPGGSATGPMLDPAASIQGDYTYVIIAGAPCIDASAVVSVSISNAPNAGTGGIALLCETEPPIDLSSVLVGADAGGIWTGPGGILFSGFFNPAIDEPGVYTYTLPGNQDCPADQATADITVSEQPSAGLDADVDVCSNTNSIDLSDFLIGDTDAGGTWINPIGDLTVPQFIPGTSLDGAYLYVIGGNTQCPGDTAIITMSTTAAPDPGSDGSLSLCESGIAVDLFTALNGAPDPGGVWTDPNGAVVGSTLDPSNGASGNYTYTLPAINLCPEASAIVNVSVASDADPGTDGMLAVCSSGLQADMLDALGGSPDTGGQWTAPDGTPHSGTFAVQTDAEGIYTYTVIAQAPCAAATSTVNVSEVPAPEAGSDIGAALCSNEPLAELSSFLEPNVDATGIWTDPNGAVVLSIDPVVALGGQYTYTLPGAAPCASDAAVLSITIDQMPSAGSANAVALCADADPVDLWSQLSGATAGGSWSGPTGTFTGWFIPSVSTPGIYSYTVIGSGACAGQSDQSDVEVQILQLPSPSFETDIRAGCLPLQVQFSNTTPGAVQSVTWSFGDGAIDSNQAQVWHTYSTPGSFNPMLTVTDMNSCSASIYLDGSIRASGGPLAQFHALPWRLSIRNPTTMVTHQAAPWVEYLWTIDGIGIDTSGSFAWTFDPATIGEHEICLIAMDTLGCSNTLCQRILVDDDLTIFVANAFTPNMDGINDGFRPSILGVEQDRYDFMVFDRWGLMVFSATDPAETWDGTMQNSGEELPQDVYVWTLRAKDQFTPEKAELIGTVTLLR